MPKDFNEVSADRYRIEADDYKNPSCDFCSSRPAPWLFLCRSFMGFEPFRLEGLSLRSEGSWAACDLCKDMVEGGLRETLAQRCLETMVKAHPEFDHEMIRVRLLEHIWTLHTKFFANRIDHPALALPLQAGQTSGSTC
jgi:hypothetical protein